MSKAKSKRRICAIAAMDESRVIGGDNRLLWSIPEDMQHFKQLTTNHAVLMGRKTYLSLPARFRPLPHRTNIVCSRSLDKSEMGTDVVLVPDLKDFLEKLPEDCFDSESQILWIIGGAEIYSASIDYWDEVHLTLVPGSHDGDAYFPSFESGFSLISKRESESCSFLHYGRRSDL